METYFLNVEFVTDSQRKLGGLCKFKDRDEVKEELEYLGFMVDGSGPEETSSYKG